MQETEIDIINTEEQGLVSKIKNWAYDNWQTILVVMIVLIVGMSAYNYNQNGNSSTDESGSVLAIEDNDSSSNENNESSTNTNSENNNDSASTEASAETEDENNAAAEDSSVSTTNSTNTNTGNTVTSVIDDNGKKYSVTASRGDGITHLARKAFGEYLKETGQGSDLTPEHKIYIEDYMQNRTGSQKISVGEQLSFSESLMTDAISRAKTLSPKSLENLQKYIK